MPSTNFLPWNPTLANQESDAAYLTDAARTGGAVLNQPFPSPLANKLFYQLSTFVAAFAAALVAKGYSPSDASQAALQTILANVLTNADMPLPTGKGGTGAVSLAAAGIMLASNLPVPTGTQRVAQVVATGQTLAHTGTITPTALYTPAAAGRYRVSFQARAAAGSVGTGLTVAITWTQGAVAHTVNNFSSSVSTDTQTSSGVLDIFPDSGTVIQYSQSQSYGTAYDLRVWLEAL